MARVPSSFVRAATAVSQVIARRDIEGAPDDDHTQVHARPSADSRRRASAADLDQDPFAPEPTVSRVMALLDAVPDPWPERADRRTQAPRPSAPQPARSRPAPLHHGPPSMPADEAGRPLGHGAALDSTPVRRGRVVALFGCRGGCGATTLAVNLGAELARDGARVCVVDLDLQLGDVFVALDLEATTSIAGLARQIRRSDEPWDEASVRRRLVRHDSGIYALSQAGRLDDIDAELADNLPTLLELLVEHFDYVLVDGVRDFGDLALTVLDAADDVALVVTQDVAAVRRAARVVSLFRTLGYDAERLRLVLNRFDRRAAIDVAEVERALGLAVYARITNDYQRVRRAFDDGAIVGDVAHTSRVASDLRALTRGLARRTDTPARRRWFPWRRRQD